MNFVENIVEFLRRTFSGANRRTRTVYLGTSVYTGSPILGGYRSGNYRVVSCRENGYTTDNLRGPIFRILTD